MARSVLIVLSLLLLIVVVFGAPLRCVREGGACAVVNNTTECCPGLQCYESTACIEAGVVLG